MLGEDKRVEALVLTHTLYQLATDLGMKLRIIDSIRVCEEALEGDMSEDSWVQIELQLNEIIGYMEKQIAGEEAVLVNNDLSVSKEAIRNRILEIWNMNRESGILNVSTYQANSVHTLQTLRNHMTDLENADANYHLLSEPELFKNKCIQLAQDYDQEIEMMAFEYLNETCEQYAQAMNRIRGLISQIDHQQIAITTRDIYEKWDNRQDLCRQQLKEIISGLDNGKKDVIRFGNEQIVPLERIKKKNRRKRSFYVLLPVLVIFILAIGGGLISFILEIASFISGSQMTDTGSNIDSILQTVDQAKDVVSTADAFGEYFSIPMPLFILLIVAYFLWVKYTGKLYRRWMVEETGTYIGSKIEEFWKRDLIKGTKDSYFSEISRSIVSCYESLFSNIFGGSFRCEGDKASETIKNVRMRWSQIRNMG